MLNRVTLIITLIGGSQTIGFSQRTENWCSYFHLKNFSILKIYFCKELKCHVSFQTYIILSNPGNSCKTNMIQFPELEGIFTLKTVEGKLKTQFLHCGILIRRLPSDLGI